MASGFNGQAFSFRGYLPQEPSERRAALLRLERIAREEGATQIFIETPYRNDRMAASMAESLDRDTLVCAAADLSLPTEAVFVSKAGAWRADPPPLGKRPALFLIAGKARPPSVPARLATPRGPVRRQRR
jgi:16S rRNA (cytidine1402-2'-O)-methyltransferase